MILDALKSWINQPPAGNRPGHTLTCALADLLGEFTPRVVETSQAVLSVDSDGPAIEVRECVERHFQMHVVSLELSMCMAARVEPGIQITVRNSGLLYRTGIDCSVPARHRESVAHLTGLITADAALLQALTVLDFRRCSLESTSNGWVVKIEPFGASEVVSRMPSFRRYIRMHAEQVRALRTAFRSFRTILETQTKGAADAMGMD